MELFLSWLLRTLLFRLPFVGLVRTVLVLVISFQIFVYLFLANGLYIMARRRGVKGPWTAWVPVFQSYALGAVAESEGGGHFLSIFLPCLQVAAGACTIFSKSAFFLPALSVILTITLAVFYFIALGRIFAQYVKHPGGLVALSVLFYFLGPIFVFSFRKKPPLREKEPATTAVRPA